MNNEALRSSDRFFCSTIRIQAQQIGFFLRRHEAASQKTSPQYNR
ncbi:hypothetical protein [Dendronalium sp. ChiSLP03b]|nr:hypothetical protein [Dendronalium sp. ChiSLP03b]